MADDCKLKDPRTVLDISAEHRAANRECVETAFADFNKAKVALCDHVKKCDCASKIIDEFRYAKGDGSDGPGVLDIEVEAVFDDPELLSFVKDNMPVATVHDQIVNMMRDYGDATVEGQQYRLKLIGGRCLRCGWHCPAMPNEDAARTLLDEHLCPDGLTATAPLPMPVRVFENVFGGVMRHYPDGKGGKFAVVTIDGVTYGGTVR
jgi:hypothetical protein